MENSQTMKSLKRYEANRASAERDMQTATTHHDMVDAMNRVSHWRRVVKKVYMST